MENKITRTNSRDLRNYIGGAVLSTELAENDYKGCGRAWAAIVDDHVVGLRYMDSFDMDMSRLPEWTLAVYKTRVLDVLSQTSYPPVVASRARNAAVEAGHPGVGPRGGKLAAKAIIGHAKRVFLDEQKRQFGEYRQAMRAELSNLSDVVMGGMCSCRTFCV